MLTQYRVSFSREGNNSGRIGVKLYDVTNAITTTRFYIKRSKNLREGMPFFENFCVVNTKIYNKKILLYYIGH